MAKKQFENLSEDNKKLIISSIGEKTKMAIDKELKKYKCDCNEKTSDFENIYIVKSYF